MHNSVLQIQYSVAYCINGPTVTNTVFFFLNKLTNKNGVFGKFPLVIIKTPMFQPFKGHYQWLRTVTGTRTYLYTCNTNVHIQCEVTYEDSGVTDVNFLLSEVQQSTQIHTLWQKVWWPCFHGYVNSQVCPLDIFEFTALGFRNCYTHIYIYIYIYIYNFRPSIW